MNHLIKPTRSSQWCCSILFVGFKQKNNKWLKVLTQPREDGIMKQVLVRNRVLAFLVAKWTFTSLPPLCFLQNTQSCDWICFSFSGPQFAVELKSVSGDNHSPPVTCPEGFCLLEGDFPGSRLESKESWDFMYLFLQNLPYLIMWGQPRSARNCP